MSPMQGVRHPRSPCRRPGGPPTERTPPAGSRSGGHTGGVRIISSTLWTSAAHRPGRRALRACWPNPAGGAPGARTTTGGVVVVADTTTVSAPPPPCRTAAWITGCIHRGFTNRLSALGRHAGLLCHRRGHQGDDPLQVIHRAELDHDPALAAPEFDLD